MSGALRRTRRAPLIGALALSLMCGAIARAAAPHDDRLLYTNLVPYLTAGQKADLIAFLKTLTGASLPRRLTRPPARP